MPSKDRIAYFYHGDMGNYYYGPGHPMKPQRLRLTHNLLLTYKMYRHLQVFKPHVASAEEMTEFHAEDYISFLSRINPGILDDYKDQLEKYSMSYDSDCPVFDGIYDFCSMYCGASLDAAARLNQRLNNICINWSGGLHHAKKAEASGFCYVNDIVLAILELLKRYNRVLYVDIDVHHGDGVEEAFYLTNRVMTLSFHKYGNYFPGTGDSQDIGLKDGKYYAVNIPLKSGMTDESYKRIFEPVVTRVNEVFQPDAIVMECGADSVTGDRLGCFNLTVKGHANCVAFVKKLGKPMMVLGGGGYTIKNVSRTWAFETSVLIDQPVTDDIPYNSFIEWYAPSYKLHLQPATMQNMNTNEYLDTLYKDTCEKLRQIEGAPGVVMQELPPLWIREMNEGITDDNEEMERGQDRDGLDTNVRHPADFYDDHNDIDHDYLGSEEDADIEADESSSVSSSSSTSSRSKLSERSRK